MDVRRGRQAHCHPDDHQEQAGASVTSRTPCSRTKPPLLPFARLPRSDRSAAHFFDAYVLEVIPAGRSQCDLKRCRPLVAGLGEPPDLVRRQAEVAEHRPEWLTGIDALRSCWRVSTGCRLCARALPNALCVSLCARGHWVQRQPLCQPAELPWCAVLTARTLAAAHRSPGQTSDQAGPSGAAAKKWPGRRTAHRPGLRTLRANRGGSAARPQAASLVQRLRLLPLTSIGRPVEVSMTTCPWVRKRPSWSWFAGLNASQSHGPVAVKMATVPSGLKS
jgi:hypothetical protein